MAGALIYHRSAFIIDSIASLSFSSPPQQPIASVWPPMWKRRMREPENDAAAGGRRRN